MAIKIFFAVLFFSSSLYAKTICVRDKLEREIKIDIPVKRAIIVITYELIPALSIWDQVVGISRWAEKECDLIKAVFHKYPYLKRPTVGRGTDMNIETIIKLNPDLVITWAYSPESIRFLEERSIKTIAIWPENLKEFYDVVRLYGRLFGKGKRAEEIIEEINKMLQLIKEKVKDIKDKKMVVYLSGRQTRVGGGRGIMNDMIKICGGINPAAVIKKDTYDVSIEKIIEWNPECIFIWGYAGYSEEDIIGNPQWRYIKAVKDKNVYKLPKWSTWSPRIAPIALWMAIKIYPERFQDISYKKLITAFYKKIFGISHEEVQRYAE